MPSGGLRLSAAVAAVLPRAASSQVTRSSRMGEGIMEVSDLEYSLLLAMYGAPLAPLQMKI